MCYRFERNPFGVYDDPAHYLGIIHIFHDRHPSPKNQILHLFLTLYVHLKINARKRQQNNSKLHEKILKFTSRHSNSTCTTIQDMVKCLDNNIYYATVYFIG